MKLRREEVLKNRSHLEGWVMGNSQSSSGWARLTPTHNGIATLVACFGLMAGQVCSALTAQPSGAVNMGSVNVGSSQTATVVFTFDTAGELNSLQPYQVVTQGLTGLDFTDAGGSTCAANVNYTVGATCFVNVKFAPRFPGVRMGAVNLYGGAAKIFATAYVYGVGVGPQIDFFPGTESTLPFTGPWSPCGVIADATGDLYIADSFNMRVVKETLNNGIYTQSTVADSATNGLGQGICGIALDGSGAVYIANLDNKVLLKETPGPSGYIQSEIVTADSAYAETVAVDGSGSLYIVTGRYGLLKLTLSNETYTQSTVNNTTYFATGAALDSAGDVYFVGRVFDYGDGHYDEETVSKATPSNGGYVVSTIASNLSGAILDSDYDVEIGGLAVDANGDLYLVFGGVIAELIPGVSGYSRSTLVVSGESPYAVPTVGENGNIYLANTYLDNILKVTTALPPSLTFDATARGAISSDSPQTVTVANTGNASLSFPVPASGDNPLISPNFTLDSSTAADCPLVPSGASGPASLAAGTSCLLPISFEPKAPAFGCTSGTLKVTDSNLNATPPNYASQTIQMAGRVLGSPPFGYLSAPVDSTTDSSSVNHSDSVLIEGWVADPSDHAPMSNVTVYIDGTSVGTPTLGIPKTAVAAKYGSADLDSGYQMLYPVASLAVGAHAVTVTAIDSCGGSTTFGPGTFTVLAQPPPFGNLASPVDSVNGTSTVSQADSVLINGWVADPVDHAPMSNVTVYIDGTSVGTPTLGIPKTEVAAKYGSADLDSGYQMLYPAASLAVGVHAVTVTAIDSEGASTRFGPLSFSVAAAPAS
jgi:hypothetical protein